VHARRAVENIWVTDIKGVVYEGRVEDMDPIKARYAKKTDARKLGEVIEGADVFLGLSAGGVLKPEMVVKMAAKPLIMALANPTPEILPGTGQERARRRDHVYRPFGLSEPGQQRALLPLHLPRRARRRGDDHYRRNEDGRGQGHRRTGPCRTVGSRRPAYGEKVPASVTNT
jgi:hypothetical protein